jgi:hypothetical protein
MDSSGLEKRELRDCELSFPFHKAVAVPHNPDLPHTFDTNFAVSVKTAKTEDEINVGFVALVFGVLCILLLTSSFSGPVPECRLTIIGDVAMCDGSPSLQR